MLTTEDLAQALGESNGYRSYLNTMGLRKMGKTTAVVLALIAVQVYYGIILAYSQQSRASRFSHSAMLAKIEMFKLLMAGVISWYQWKGRRAETRKPDYASIPEDADLQCDSKPASNALASSFYEHIMGLFTPNEIFRVCQLSMLYAALNLSTFTLIKHVDPGTIQLMKSGVTIVTAFVSVVTVKASVNRHQWGAILLLTCGLLTTQLTPENHDSQATKYGMQEYLGLVVQLLVTAAAGVYNEATVKAINATPHELNLVLYSSGSIIYVLIYFWTRGPHDGGANFSAGDGSLVSTLVFLGAVGLGIVMTMAYKYTDAMTKCLATAISTGLLLIISHVLFGNPQTLAFLPGIFVVYYSIWAYVRHRDAPISENPSDKIDKEARENKMPTRKSRSFPLWGTIKLLLSWFATISFIVCYNQLLFTPRALAPTSLETPIVSPFRDTLAFIRIHKKRPERVKRMDEYRSFFRELHISMPRDADLETTLTEDSYEDDNDHHYSTVIKTLSIILDNPDLSDITGMLYFNFDVWVEPLLFSDMNFTRMWITDRDLNFECNVLGDEVPAWYHNNGHPVEKILKAFANVVETGYLSNTTTPIFCHSWSDLYYIPRKWFPDFIKLASIYVDLDVFHESAIPTVLTLIDMKYRPHKYSSLVDRIADCIGGPIGGGITLHDINWRRCGHKLYHDIDQFWLTHLVRLKEQGAMLSKTPQQTLDEHPTQ